ncbi:hypothetical protein [Sutcliffiella deserti]|uniref:hypothetical protein n=1 Tax=Sutcliffiella deserti TaxID=2875501 RepID=UPI001CBB065B|nr:hypothetical protein [Sutcliffiella deserti]
MKEIGGYFGLDEFVNNEYYRNLVRLNTGRNALIYLLKAKGIKKLYIPYFLCNSVSNILEKYKYTFEYYYIDEHFNPIFNKNLLESEYLYIVNYYGQFPSDKVRSFQKKYKRVILDNTQAFFQKPLDGIDTIYSCRKFFGVPDGAYLSTDMVLCENLELDISKERMTHILGRYESMASEYYNDFQENDASYKNESLKYMSKLTRNILGAIDYEKVREVRNENYDYLDQILGIQNKIKVIKPNGAFSYPYYIENGLEVRKNLAKKKIYLPTLWPNVLRNMSEDSIEYRYTANILPLPCDQRYGVGDMKQIISCL